MTGTSATLDLGLYDAKARWYDAEHQRFLSEDPLGSAGGDTNLYNYAGGDPVNQVDPTGTKNLPVIGEWSGEMGNSWFSFEDPSLPIIRYRNGQPDFKDHIWRDDKRMSNVSGVVTIQLDGDLSKTKKVRHKVDVRAANKEMRGRLEVSDWKPPKGYVWHHQWVDGTGKGQMVLVEKNVHRASVHKGAFGIYTDILEARESGDRSKIAKAHKLRRSLGFIGRVARGAAPPVAAFLTFNLTKQGWAEEGAVGVGKVLVRDVVFADEVEGYLFPEIVRGARAVGDHLKLNEEGDKARTQKRFGAYLE